MPAMTLARSNSFASADRGTNRWETPYRSSPLFIPTTNSELQTGIFVVPARLSLLDQHDPAAKPASLPHIVSAVHARIERKGKTMEYELKQNAARGPSIEESRRVRGGAAVQRDGRRTAVAVDEPDWTMSRSIRASSPRRSPAGGSFMSLLTRTLRSQAPRSTILIRLIVGGVFLTEGIQKFLLPGELGVGRFVKIGIPIPEVMAPFVGVVEIVGGALLLVGLLTRLATIPLIVNMLVAIGTTKLPILFKDGLWKAVHESRVDGSMLLGSIFLLIVGAGLWSLDVWLLAGIARKHRE
jgi:uncharacterized membrane protein YphA (DoxX/SURF4 family)